MTFYYFYSIIIVYTTINKAYTFGEQTFAYIWYRFDIRMIEKSYRFDIEFLYF